MTNFTKKSFSVSLGSDAYRENFDRVFSGAPITLAPEPIDWAQAYTELRHRVELGCHSTLSEELLEGLP